MNLLNLENVSKTFTDRILFDKVSLGINEGDKIGVIGINGTGKSTLLKIISGLLTTDEGQVVSGKNVNVEYLPQTPVFDNKKTIIENITEGKKSSDEYINLEAQAKGMLQKLGIFNADDFPTHLSGGQKKRVALVRTLLLPADILVLDEPTNHLDNTMTEWLEDYLKKYKGAFIMVTHDRYFLDEVTNKIIELDKAKLYTYQTNFTGFLELKAAREDSQTATERKNRTLYKTELAWIRRGARARSTKQKAHIQRFEALRDRDKIQIDDKIEINSISKRLGKKTIEVNNITKSYNDKCLIKNFEYIFLANDRIGIVGPNGCGKSTLLKIITKNILPDEGDVVHGETVKIGFFSQENDYMDTNLKVIDYIQETALYIDTVDGKITASQMLEKFLFTGAMQYSLINKLSGGEKRRLYLLKILMEAPNVLILDEPTNDLDISTLAILEEYLSSFAGIIITVSHDRYFLDKIINCLFVFSQNNPGEIIQLEGEYTENLETIHSYMNSDNNKVEKEKNISKQNWKENKQVEQKKKMSYNEQREWNTMDADIKKIEAEIESFDKQIEEATSNYTKLQELVEFKNNAEAKLEEKMERWMFLSENYDM